MTVTGTEEQHHRQLRLWPGIVVVTLLCFLWLGLPAVMPEAMIAGLIGALVCGLAVLVWWMFFSRAPWAERVGAFVAMIAAVALTRLIVHPSIAGAGMGRLYYIYAIPPAAVGLVVGAVLGRRFAAGPRRATLLACILLACGSFALLRTDGITGDGRSQFAWRWAPTREQLLLARGGAEPVAPPATVAKDAAVEPSAAATLPPAPTPEAKPPVSKASHQGAPPDWPGFRGPGRDSRVPAVRIKTDWATSRPVELWRRPVGPGWSSFAAGDGLLYTQEQRGDFEVVACYRLATGEPVWTHRNQARFWESNAGAGPRGTPTLNRGRVFALGATGILNALDAATGSPLWTRNAAIDTGAKIPEWGIASSPLLVNGMVIAAASGRLAAYNQDTGEPKWYGPKIGGSYSSPQLLTIGGAEQVVLLTSSGATGFAPDDGKVLWKHAWAGTAMLQPALTGNGGLLITAGDMSGGMGTRRIAVTQEPAGWTTKEVWTSKGLKPYYNDLVVHDGYAYGFDGSILSCIDLKDGERKWKGGRYGHGQLILLPDQNLLLVLSEEGEVALVSASPGQFTEIAKIPAVEGKTWNHPALAGDTLLVRNGQEMAAFRLARAGD